MSIEIFYFSGTGNSLAVAKDISDGIGGSLIPLASEKGKTVSPKADVVGIVFPVYYGDPPAIVKEFAGKLDGLEGKYVFAVCTYGGAAMASLRVIRRIISSRGGRLSAAFGIPMPQNSFYKPKENQAELYAAWKKRLPFIVDKIESRAKGMFYTHPFLEMLIAPIQTIIIRPMCKKAFAKMTNMPRNSKIEQLVRRLDSGFITDANCIGCGICSRVCPVKNIVIRDKRPEWLHHCENCLACYNWCPNKAISGGITSKDYYYRHFQVGATEIMKQQGL